MSTSPAHSPKPKLTEVALFYLRLGITAFGGPAAHMAMMEHELVRRRNWLSREQFLDYLGIVNLIPGPSSTELAIQIGYSMCGWPGLLLGGICFILPAALLTLALAFMYARYGSLPRTAALFYGIKPVIIAIVLQAIWRLGRTAIKSRLLAAVALLALLAAALGVNVLAVLFGAGVLVVILDLLKSQTTPANLAMQHWISKASFTGVASTIGGSVGAAFSLSALFLFFLKVGAVLFGSGYVLLAFLRHDLVVRLHWMTDAQLLDAIAVGQMTPGPVFTTATFVGYLLGKLPGAAVATVGIFLPSFVFIALIGRVRGYLRGSKLFGGFLDGVNAGALALMAVVTFQLGRAALIDTVTYVLALFSLIVLVRFKFNSAVLVIAGALVGLIASR